nr:MAG TPA: structural protein [Caudoviricetes sp.]
MARELNMANRQCCDVHILDYATMKPWMLVDFCNTTTAGFSADAVYANKKGAKDIKFDNPLEGTMKLNFQVHPFQIYALYSDGEIETSALIARRENVTGAAEGKLTLTNTPKAGTVYAVDPDTGKIIEGTVTEKEFTATTTSEIKEGTTYEVSYLEEKTAGVKKISFNNKKTPKDFFIQMETVDKDEKGNLVPVRITAYKASPNRTLDLSFSSDGDPAEIEIELSVLQNEDGDVMDIIEITE